jgi:N-glycosylase/DNA lyase
MERGALDLAAYAGGLDLQATLESGQSYCWGRADGGMYDADRPAGGDAWYHTVVPADATPSGDPELVRARQDGDRLLWESTTDAAPLLASLLRLDDDLPAIRAAAPDDAVVADAWDAFEGMRLVADPPFRSLVSFVCSAQMRVARIHAMQESLASAFGDAVTVDGDTYHAFPTPAQLATATEADLRDLGLGYRAPYVVDTAEMVADGRDPDDARGMAYEDARAWLAEFVGVGQKVADCVLLFSLGFLEAVPLDTWIRTAIAEHFPDCDRESYDETSRAIRERLGGEYAGYVQTYVFHHLRTAG